MLYFATYHLHTGSGVEITGSHNPPDYNGMKIVLAGEALYGDGIQALCRRIRQGDLVRAQTPGALRSADIAKPTCERIVGDVKLARPMKVAIDCGNGVAGAVAPGLFRALGCEVAELFCEVDGTFPNHHPDPAHPENLQDLIQRVRRTDAEIGLAFDGDGDRLGVVTKDGEHHLPGPADHAVRPRRAGRASGRRDHLRRQVHAPSGALDPPARRPAHHVAHRPLAHQGAAARDRRAFAGEMSGHLFFNDRWYGFDDGLYAGARLLEILSRSADPRPCSKRCPTPSARRSCS